MNQAVSRDKGISYFLLRKRLKINKVSIQNRNWKNDSVINLKSREGRYISFLGLS